MGSGIDFSSLQAQIVVSHDGGKTFHLMLNQTGWYANGIACESVGSKEVSPISEVLKEFMQCLFAELQVAALWEKPMRVIHRALEFIAA